MRFLGNLLLFFESEMTTPTAYGWFHLMWFALVILASVALCVRFHDCSDRTFRRIALILWVVMAVLELYKQLVYSLEYENGILTWDYQWYAFPYQFCSTPLYILPFLAFLPDGARRDRFIGYMAFFSFFGGVAVMFYPGDVFIRMIGINVQSMIHHGIQVVMGVFCAVWARRRLNLRYYLRSAPVFVTLFGIAIVMNYAIYAILQACGIDETFSMFYVSPYFPSHLPILSSIYPLVPFPVFAAIYCIGFLLIGLILYYAQFGINKLVDTVHARRASARTV